MSRDALDRLDDMIEAAEQIVAWTPAQGAPALAADVRLRYQLERAMQILGEAAKKVPAEWKERAPNFPWREAAGMRDVLAHAYFDCGKSGAETRSTMTPSCGSAAPCSHSPSSSTSATTFACRTTGALEP